MGGPIQGVRQINIFAVAMRIRLFFILIIAYIIVAFGWLTWSLISAVDNEYILENQVLRAGKQACVLRIIEKGKNSELLGPDSGSVFLQQIELKADTNSIHRYLRTYNYGSYAAEFRKFGDRLAMNVVISKGKLDTLRSEHRRKVRLHLFQAILLTLLVGTGVFGVFYSVNSIYNLNKQQNNFLLSVTHEFKTPIAAMKLMLQTIQRRDLSKEKQAELLENAIANADRLNELTENMLTAMQIENKKYIYQWDEFSLSDMMERIVHHYSLTSTVYAEIEPDVFIPGDRFVLRISLNNIVENALKYSNYEPIWINMKREGQSVEITVADNGRGIPLSERSRIFKRFYRIQDEETRETKGTGLGLYIVKQTIKKHGGSIKIIDNVPQGTIVHVSLPLN